MLSGNEHPSMVLRPSRVEVIGSDATGAPEPYLKIQRVSDELVMERRPPDAFEMVATEEFVFVPASSPSLVDTLLGLDSSELRGLLQGAGLNVHPRSGRVGMISLLVPLVEAGTVTLD